MTAPGRQERYDRVGGARVPDAVVSAVRRGLPNGAVLGVSGGPDSTALAAAAAHLGRDVVLAHFHHGVRGREADTDATFARDLAARLGVPFVMERADSLKPTEDVMRRARYDFLLRVARDRNATAVAVAHTADDQAETVLMRLIRGSGTLGLGAMAPTRPFAEGVSLVRPLLGVTRAQIEAFLQHEGLTWRQDSSNDDTRRLRARVRHELLPLLRTYNPRIVETLCRTAELLRDDEAALRAWPEGTESPLAVRRRQIRVEWQRRTGSPLPLNYRHVIAAIQGGDLPRGRADG